MPATRSGRHTKTTTARGLGQRHKQQAAHLKRHHVDGTPCWWCAEPMYLAQGLAADHSVPRSQGGTLADRLLHSWCNNQRGDGHRDHERPALTGRKPTREAIDLGRRVMRWPA